MKCVIAGRDYIPNEESFNIVKSLVKHYKITLIVSGHASGADTFGETCAKKLNLKLKVFPADWNKYGKRAGYIRNYEMGKYTDYVILFKGGKGTMMMRDIAIKLNKKIIYEE
jgi:hypothetical protein